MTNFYFSFIGNHLTLPPAVSLTRCDIYKSGSENIIRDCCRDVEELDLASNNLKDLNQIFNIVKEVKFDPFDLIIHNVSFELIRIFVLLYSDAIS